MSHSLRDAQAVLGIKRILESGGLTVYVDWVEDPQLDRTQVTVATADHLRARMNQSTAMVFVTSQASSTSKWMPWELGYFDGRQRPVTILPLLASATATFIGQEYLGLYPVVEKEYDLLGGQYKAHAVRRRGLSREAVTLSGLLAGRSFAPTP
jgi:hypothetical protein